jgi:hypothetical protein
MSQSEIAGRRSPFRTLLLPMVWVGVTIGFLWAALAVSPAVMEILHDRHGEIDEFCSMYVEQADGTVGFVEGDECEIQWGMFAFAFGFGISAGGLGGLALGLLAVGISGIKTWSSRRR